MAYRWTKHLPKKGEAFDDVVAHLQSIELHHLAARFSKLQDVVIESRLAALTAESSLLFMPGSVTKEPYEVSRGSSISETETEMPHFFEDLTAHLDDESAGESTE